MDWVAAKAFGLTIAAVALLGMSGMAHADATQPTVVRPEIAQFRIDRAASGECDMISVRAGSDESLFGSNGSDGIR